MWALSVPTELIPGSCHQHTPGSCGRVRLLAYGPLILRPIAEQAWFLPFGRLRRKRTSLYQSLITAGGYGEE